MSRTYRIIFLALCLFIAEFEFTYVDIFVGGRDWTQTYLKGAIFLLVSTIGLIELLRAWHHQRFHPVLVGFGLFLLWQIVAAGEAPQPLVGLSTASLCFGLYVFLLAVDAEGPDGLSPQHNGYTYFAAIGLGCGLMVLCSAIGYLANPTYFSVGGAGFGGVARIRGMMGDPNALGRVCIALLLVVVFGRNKRSRGSHVSLWGLWIAVTTLCAIPLLIFTDSRTSWIAFLLTILILVYLSLVRRRGTGLLTMVAGVGGLGFACSLLWYQVSRGSLSTSLLQSGVLRQMSRTGRVQELLTLSYRTELWKFVLHEIARRPLTGWGYRASNQIIPTQWGALSGALLPNAQCMYLEIAMAMGVIALALFLSVAGWLFLTNLRLYLIHKDQEALLRLGLLCLILIDGITELSAFGSTNVYFLLFCIVLIATCRASSAVAGNRTAMGIA